MAKRSRAKVPGPGTVVAIPLPKGKFAFAKLFRDYDFGVYDLVSDKIEPLEVITSRPIAIYQAVNYAPLKAGKWPVIGVQPFADEEAGWAPPRAIGIWPDSPPDPLEIGIDHKGISKSASLQEVAGLDIKGFYPEPGDFVEMLVDFLVKGNRSRYRVPK